jgi:hypothetical protein
VIVVAARQRHPPLDHEASGIDHGEVVAALDIDQHPVTGR